MVFATLRLHFFILTVVAYQCWGCHCPKGFKRYANSCYHFSHDIETFGVADMMCHHMGGHLARIESSAENAFIAAEVKLIGADVWIGLTDVLAEGYWTWYDGMVPIRQYSNWNNGEPNDLNREDGTVVLPHNGKWNDLACHRNERYVCEKKTQKHMSDKQDISLFGNKQHFQCRTAVLQNKAAAAEVIS